MGYLEPKFYLGKNGHIYSEKAVMDAFYIMTGRPFDGKTDRVTDMAGIEKETDPTIEDFIRENNTVRAAYLYYKQRRAAGDNISIKEAKEAVGLIRSGMQDGVELLRPETALKRMKDIMDKTPVEENN